MMYKHSHLQRLCCKRESCFYIIPGYVRVSLNYVFELLEIKMQQLTEKLQYLFNLQNQVSEESMIPGLQKISFW